MNKMQIILNGILKNNPTFVLVLGMCPTLAITKAASSGLGMGLATTFVLVFSNMVVSMLRNIIPEKVRIPSYVVVIATFVTIVQMVMQAFLPSLYDALGLFIPLIVVNCIILARAEAFASKNGPVISAVDGLGMGLGFTCSITLIGIIRELIGNGTVFGISLLGASYQPMLLFVLAPGGFITFGLVLGIINAITARGDKKEG
jgi:electron transport complex protein RnfE